MVSKEAEERRLRFLAAKEAAGGSFASLMKQELSKKPKVYFLEDGTIVSITKEDIDVNPNWLCREFDEEQLQILEDQNWNLFYIKKDPLVDNLYSIESKPLESSVVSSENMSLTCISQNENLSAECICSLNEYKFTVTLSETLLDQYKDIDPFTATANGQKVLKFYFTAPQDPHFMFHSEYVNLANLLKYGSISITLPELYSNCSIYTVKAFNSYTRV